MNFVALVVLLLVGAGAGAQERQASSPQEPVIRSDVRQVLVPFTVTDRRGHYVPDLKPSDFEVLEDGQIQRIVGSIPSPPIRPETL